MNIEKDIESKILRGLLSKSLFNEELKVAFKAHDYSFELSTGEDKTYIIKGNYFNNDVRIRLKGNIELTNDSVILNIIAGDDIYIEKYKVENKDNITYVSNFLKKYNINNDEMLSYRFSETTKEDSINNILSGKSTIYNFVPNVGEEKIKSKIK